MVSLGVDPVTGVNNPELSAKFKKLSYADHFNASMFSTQISEGDQRNSLFSDRNHTEWAKEDRYFRCSEKIRLTRQIDHVMNDTCNLFSQFHLRGGGVILDMICYFDKT